MYVLLTTKWYKCAYLYRCHAIVVSDNAEYFHHHINATLDTMGLTEVRSAHIIDIIEGHKGRGYGVSTSEELGEYDTLDTVGLTEVRSADIIDIIEGHKGRGYGVSTSEELGEYDTLDTVGLTEVRSADIIDIIEGHKGRGYGVSTSEELG